MMATPRLLSESIISASRSNSRGVRLDVGSSMAMTEASDKQRLGDLDDLPLGHSEVADFGGHVDRRIEHGEDFIAPACAPPPG